MFLDYFGYYLYNILTFFAIYIIVFKTDFVKAHKKEIVMFLLALLLYTQYRRYGARLFTPSFSYPIDSLPIHFCRMSALMTLLYLITKNKIIKGFVFFQSGLGFLSVLVPGGYFFIMTQDWRSLTYMWDHFMLAIMPFFIVLIDGYRVQKRDFIISLVYSIVVPLAVLPLAIATNYNAYYVLDGVIVKDLFGDNQFVITSVMLVLLVIYNILMWYAGKSLEKVELKRFNLKTTLFKPLYPWVLVTGYVVAGVIIAIFYVRPVPQYLVENTTTYQAKPVQVYGEKIVVYKGMGEDGEQFYFFEALHDKTIEMCTFEFDTCPEQNLENGTVGFFDALNFPDNQIFIALVSNVGEDNEAREIFSFTVPTEEEFLDGLEN